MVLWIDQASMPTICFFFIYLFASIVYIHFCFLLQEVWLFGQFSCHLRRVHILLLPDWQVLSCTLGFPRLLSYFFLAQTFGCTHIIGMSYDLDKDLCKVLPSEHPVNINKIYWDGWMVCCNMSCSFCFIFTCMTFIHRRNSPKYIQS